MGSNLVAKRTFQLIDGTRLNSEVMPSGACQVYAEGNNPNNPPAKLILDLTNQERETLILNLGGHIRGPAPDTDLGTPVPDTAGFPDPADTYEGPGDAPI